MLKRISLVLVLAICLTLAFTGAAYANFGPHGGYVDDTDACAGCHRAHTSFIDLTWTDDTIAQAEHSALLISSADVMSEFCNACHGDAAPGASTNVVSGVFDSGPSGEIGTEGTIVDGVLVEWETNSTFDATLNGGGFEVVPDGAVGAQTYKTATSSHGMDLGASTGPAWGDVAAWNGTDDPFVIDDQFGNLTCTSCHDPHGSSNYRLLKDSVNTVAVGGYIDDLTPTPFVISAEEGYPYDGWKKHEAGAAQMAVYKPNYTNEEYRNKFGGAIVPTFDREGDLSGWCSACHGMYIERNDDLSAYAWSADGYDYNTYIQGEDGTDLFNVNNPEGATFHRHPVNVTLAAGDPDNLNMWLRTAVAFDDQLPLEMEDGGDPVAFRAGTKEHEDYLGCLTCHVAHGTSADMTGYAEASLETTDGGYNWYPVRLTQPTTSGVDPTFTSALLRTDNRGVCERCHNK